ncbi:MAG: sulfotransferase family protein [Egibacteraceae bacterium]
MTERAFIVGAQRSGTTYLAELLDAHPEIELARPLRPEPKWFLEAGFDGDVARHDTRWFSGVTPVRVEKATSYVESALALERLAATFPKALVLVMLRDPVERALSHWRFSALNGVESLPADEALLSTMAGHERAWDRDQFSVSPFDYIGRGRYAEQLERLWRHVPHDQTMVLLYEELVADPAVIAAVYERLDVDPDFRPTGLDRVVNAAAGADVAPDVRAALARHYATPNVELARLLGRSLPAWQ